MTKFILHGGDTRIDNQDNNIFFTEFTKDFPTEKNINILLIYFAKDESMWSDLARQDVDKISNFSKAKSISFQIAKKNNFEKQIKKADVVYFRGGDTFKLVDKLLTIKNFSLLLKDKVVVGSSAGVYALCKYFYENDENKLGKGLGILNIKAFCHYDESNKNKLETLKKYKEKLGVLVLPAFKYKVIYQDLD